MADERCSRVFTFGLVGIGIAQAILFFFQLTYMRRGMEDTATAANAAKDGARAALEANALNRKNSMADRRPWLGISEVEFITPLSFIDVGANVTVQVKVKNAGRSPALKVEVIAELFLMKSGVTRLNEFPEAFREKLATFAKHGGSAVFPNDVLTAAQAMSILRQEIDDCSHQIREMRTISPMLRVGASYESDQGESFTTFGNYIMMGVRCDLKEVSMEALQPDLHYCEAT